MSQALIFNKQYLLKNENDTALIAYRISKMLNPGISIGLIGELGAGKTTLVRHLVKCFGYSENISSPTFVLSHEYPLSNGVIIEHWDLYRTNGLPEELHENCDNNVIRLIEWADKAICQGLMPDMICKLSYQHTNHPEKRLLVLEKSPLNSLK